MAYLDRTALVDGGPALEATGLVHRVHLPTRAGPHPTLVLLHGLGGDEDAMWLLGAALPRAWLAVAPRAPIPRGGGFTWRPREGDEWPTLEAFDPSVALVRRLVESLPSLYGADPEEVYLVGFSQGAALSLATAMRHPGIARAIVSVVGFVPTDCAASDLVPLEGLPVFMAVGVRDGLIPLERSRACAGSLGAAGVDLEYHEYDVGHKLGASGARDVRAWLVARHEESVARRARQAGSDGAGGAGA